MTGNLLWNFYCVDDFRNNLVCGDVLSLCLVCKADTVAKHLKAHCADVLRNHIASSLDEGISL
jgi:hypothetical protein